MRFFVSGIQQKLELLDYQAAKISISDGNKNSRKIWRNSIHFGVSVTFVSFGINVQLRLLRWTQMELPPWLNAQTPPPDFQDKSHPLKEYDSALNVLPEILMSGPIARFHCNKCWYTFMWWSCLHSWGCFSAGSTINSFKGRSELNQTDIYHRVMEDIKNGLLLLSIETLR